MTFPCRLAAILLITGAGLLAGAALAPAAPLPAVDGVPAPIGFTVNRDGTPIGTQRLTFHTESGPGGERLIVDSTIDVKVRAAFVTLYRYTFTGRETWQGGKLVAMDTATDDDGTKFTVHVRAGPAGLKVDATDAHYVAPADTIPDSYWPADTVKRRRFIDIETGKLVDMISTPAGHRTISAAGKPVEVSVYKLRGIVTGEVGYAPDGTWTLLDVVTRGSDIVYTPQAPVVPRPR